VIPAIGLSAAVVRARWSHWHASAHLLSRSYADAIQRAGGLAVLLPPDPRAIDDPEPWLDLLDGLILTGGADIDPATYGAEPDPHTKGTVPERDRFEIALTRGALERDLPLLGVCRGMQVMNIARGGTLIQHLPDSVGHEDHRRTLGSFENADHDVRLADGSLALQAAGEKLHSTKSHHHQAIDRLGEGFEVTGWATIDDLPETIEDPSRRFALGVQWHPEADVESQLIAALVDRARTEAVGSAMSTPRPSSSTATSRART
jgi:putative glutamine amidotransferase